MSELGSLLAPTVTRLFGDLVTKELIESAEKGAWPDKLWRALEEGGLTLPLVPEEVGRDDPRLLAPRPGAARSAARPADGGARSRG